MKAGTLLALVVFTFTLSYSQSQHKMSGGSAQGTLTVSVTVVPSVWLIMEAEGKQEIMVANAPDSKESFSQPAHPKPKPSARPSRRPAKAVSPVAQQKSSSEVSYRFPTGSTKFEVTEETKMMNVTEGGKTTQQPVRVTTVVPQ
jgi:hypothetical protein